MERVIREGHAPRTDPIDSPVAPVHHKHQEPGKALELHRGSRRDGPLQANNGLLGIAGATLGVWTWPF